jgi:hypothetical protein
LVGAVVPNGPPLTAQNGTVLGLRIVVRFITK